MTRINLLVIPMSVCFLGLFTTMTCGQTVDPSRSGNRRKPRFISFDTNSGKIDINLDLSVPFLSIPLEDKNEHGGPPQPLLSVNTKALTIFGLIMALSTFIVPLFVKKIPEIPIEQPAHQHHHYRSDRGSDFWHLGDSLNEILFRDSRVTPCLQRVVCTAVATAASRSDNPSSADKIIDGLASHRWFEQAANGTAMKEAVARGRAALAAPDECADAYKGCAMSQRIVANLLKMIGV